MTRPENLDSITPLATRAADALNHAAEQSSEALHHLASKAGDLTHRRVEQWRDQGQAWREGTTEHIQAHPLRSVLLATGAGMLIAWLARGLSR